MNIKLAVTIVTPLLLFIACSKKPDTDRIQSLESELDRLKAEQRGKPSTQPVNSNRPSTADMLPVAELLTTNTFGSSAGNDHRRFLKPVSVTIKDASVEGPLCHVVFDIEIEYLPAFKEISAIGSDATNRETPSLMRWIPTTYGTERAPDGAYGYVIDHDWLSKQRNFPGTTLTGVKVLMRKWDTGWRFEGPEQ